MIKINEMNFSYKSQPSLFNHLSLSLKAGSITGLLGKNGAGKTSFLKLLLGLLRPVSGTVEVLNSTPEKRNASFLQNVFFVPEEFDLPAVPIKRYMKANSGFYPAFSHELFDRLMKEFELAHEQSLHKISHGQRKKFLIAFGLATKCRLLIMDEPTNGLDIPSKAIFRKVMAGALDDDQLVIISTHQVRDIEMLIDQIVILDNGSLVMQKEMHEIAARLKFTNRTVLPEGEEIIYSEASPGGYKVISRQTSGDSSVDIELLFNAVISNKEIFNNYGDK